MMKQITLFVFLLSTIICCNAANEANCDVNLACKKGTYITLDGKKYNYSVAMGVKHSNTEEMTIKCIINPDGIDGDYFIEEENCFRDIDENGDIVHFVYWRYLDE